MSKRIGKIERGVRKALDATGLPWEIHVSGSMHKQIYLAGRKIGVICLEDQKRKDDKQIMAKIRGRIRELQGA